MTLFCLHTTRLVELFCAKLEQSEAVCCAHTQTGGKMKILRFYVKAAPLKVSKSWEMRGIIFFQLF